MKTLLSKTLLSTALVVASAALAGAQQPAAPVSPTGTLQIDRIVGVAGTTPILWSDVLTAMNADRSKIPSDSAGVMRMAEQIVNLKIDEQLLVDRAKAEKIEVTDQDVSTAVDPQFKAVRTGFKGTDQEFRDELRKSGFGSPEEYRRWLSESTRRTLLQRKLFEKLKTDGKLAAAPVTDADIKDFFEKNKGQLGKRPATVSFRQIVIAPKASDEVKKRTYAKAESLLVELRKGGDFEQIAKRESQDPGSKELGGDLGWHRRSDLLPEFERVAFNINPGVLSPIVETAYGYHIIRVDRIQPGEIKVRHILLRPPVDSSDVARTRILADSIVALWRGGAKYDDLVAKYHDPVEEKVAPPFPRDSLPVPYQKAFAGKGANTIVDPFQIDDPARGVPKFVIAQITEVTEARDATVADFREQIRSQISEERSIRRFLDTLRKQTYVEVRLADVPTAKPPAAKP